MCGGWGVRLGRREGLCASSALACLGDLNTPVDELDRRVVMVVSAYLTATATATCGHSHSHSHSDSNSHTHHDPMGVSVNGSESESKRFRFRPMDHPENGSENESSRYTEGESSQAGMSTAPLASRS